MSATEHTAEMSRGVPNPYTRAYRRKLGSRGITNSQDGRKTDDRVNGYDTWYDMLGLAPVDNRQAWPRQGARHQLQTWSGHDGWRSGHQSSYCMLLQW
jgi:hypothetical protein